MIRDFETALTAIQAGNSTLHAFAAVLDPEAAAHEAATLRGPLAGRTVAVKDIFDTANLPTEYGSPIYAGHQPRIDATIVRVLRDAGALVIGKSVTTEFAYLQPARTRNPKAPMCTPGGSSSGSAAAVAAGLVDFAIGSQTGGSTVRPASYCGIAGFKPTFGLLPTNGMKCFSWSLDTVGVFAPTVRDLAEPLGALTGSRTASPGPRQPEHFKVGIPADYPWGDLTPSAQAALALATQKLQDAGIEVVQAELPTWVREAFLAHAAIQGWEACRALSWELDEHPQKLSQLLREYLNGSRSVTDESYAAAQAAAVLARENAMQWVQGVDVFLTPSAPDEPPHGYSSTGPSTFNRAWTLLGTPTLNVPGAFGVNGLPMGLQVVARPGDDAGCLAFGMLLEELIAR